MTSDFETIRRAFAVFNSFDGPDSDELWWRVDSEYAPITLLINCNDYPSNIEQLERAYTDCILVNEGPRAHLLFCCRKRKMRPQKPYYKHLAEALHPLFDACGPERIV